MISDVINNFFFSIYFLIVIIDFVFVLENGKFFLLVLFLWIVEGDID